MTTSIQTTATTAIADDHSLNAPSLIGLSCCTPTFRQPQDEVGESLARLWNLEGARRARWDRIVRGSGIEFRSAVLPLGAAPTLPTSERMRLFERHAPDLAERAATQAIERTRVNRKAITDVIVVTCTGFAAPGVDVELQRRLGLQPDTRRSTIGFMGCFGAITGLRAACGAALADPDAVVLLVCVELCSLHLRSDDDLQNQVASAIFADGAAAAIVTRNASLGHSGGAPSLRLCAPGRSWLIPERRDDMSWRITDEGFAMTLSPAIPDAIESALPEFVMSLQPAPNAMAMHPGGAAILDAASRSVPPFLTTDIDAARAVLRDHGNMSSPSVLFVLERLLEAKASPPICLIAFGPGLTIDSITLESPAVP